MNDDCDLAILMVEDTGIRGTSDEPIALHSLSVGVLPQLACISSSIDAAYLSCDNIGTKPKLLWQSHVDCALWDGIEICLADVDKRQPKLLGSLASG